MFLTRVITRLNPGRNSSVGARFIAPDEANFAGRINAAPTDTFTTGQVKYDTRESKL